MPIIVCIVEDESSLRESMRRFINLNTDFQCPLVFSSAEELLAGPLEPRPDVVLMDINLPRMNGIQCVSRLKSLMPEVQIMMLTVYENSNRIFEALTAGASGFLVKNTPPEKLLEAIRDVANGGGPMSSHIARKVIKAFQPVHKDESNNKGSPTVREKEILELLSRGFAYKQIAAELNLSIGTIQTHVSRIYKKLHVNCRTEAVVKYLDATGQRPYTFTRSQV
ncbi:MAG TPA: response regulator transcription factor [Verrucomicrobiae bacterium]|jgi:DNA-binding NarL/FixJ family response regulator